MSSPPRARRPPNDLSPPDVNSEMVRWTRILSIFTVVLAVASCIADVFIIGQWHAATEAQQDTRQQLRAAVGWAGVTIVPANMVNKQPTTYALVGMFQNYGNTRTNTFTAWDSVKYFEHDVPNDQDFTRPYNKIETHNLIIGPNSPQVLGAVTLSKIEVDHVIHHDGVAVLWGHADWSDVFDRTTSHPINVCVFLIPQLAPDGNLVGFNAIPVRPDCNTSG